MIDRELRVPGTPTEQGYIGLALVVGTGLSTSCVALLHASRTQFSAIEAIYVFTPVIVSIALVVAGTLLWTTQFGGREMLRIGTAVFLGMTVFGLLITWTITHEFIRGGSVAHAPFVTVNSMTVGAFVGLVLGWLDARNRRYETTLRQERNKFKRQTEELDEFAAIVSHDLRNPLNVATLNSSVRRRRPAERRLKRSKMLKNLSPEWRQSSRTCWRWPGKVTLSVTSPQPRLRR
ncbi:hypothetical protein [Halovenus salina]|uniref:Signal transduction histidine kinase dimerisation/phosphoacceptor domain-containing protein n=1 Tax=Halovenus salina TaxID=1510225 RepID=A0ABD5W0K2_9EURY